MRLAELVDYCGGQLLRGDPAADVSHFSTDTRSLHSGDCFLALRGPNYDGHQFVTDAARLGASAAVVSDPTCAMHSPSALALLQVPDTLTALHQLATNYRRQMPSTTRIVGITGSCGKTTTKEMVAGVLGQRFQVVKTDGNRNNHIGVPLNVLRLDHRHEFGVFELGTNHPGEIAALAGIVRPHIGVITNIGLAHVEFLHDEAGVANEKGALIENLPGVEEGWAILNADDKWCGELRNRTKAAVLTVGIEKFADIRASNIMVNGDLKFRLNIARKREDVIIRLKTLGRHQIYNALQAAAVGYAVGMDLEDIRAGLESVEFPSQRMQVVDRQGVRFVNDCYNANMPSMEAAMQTLSEQPWPGRKLAVVGDMLELGEWTRMAHLRIGAQAAGAGLSLLVTVGDAARDVATGAMEAGMEAHKIVTVANASEAASLLRSLVREGDFVLLKASRRMKLEEVLESFRE
jgi:UDP-N-acetylmuramoyl-tripeptide--D-alanyl-D-alanine ligase